MNKIQWYHWLLLISSLAWSISIILSIHLHKVVSNCSTHEELVLEPTIKNFMSLDPFGFCIIIAMVCMPIDFLSQIILPQCVDLICTKGGLSMTNWLLLILKFIIFAPCVLIFLGLIYVPLNSLKNEIISRITNMLVIDKCT